MYVSTNTIISKPKYKLLKYENSNRMMLVIKNEEEITQVYIHLEPEELNELKEFLVKILIDIEACQKGTL